MTGSMMKYPVTIIVSAVVMILMTGVYVGYLILTQRELNTPINGIAIRIISMGPTGIIV